MNEGTGDLAHVVVDGGDRACGELLLVLAGQVHNMPARTPVRLVATDPAAVLDVPAWCHLTGHSYVGPGRQPDGRPHYDLQTSAAPRPTHSMSPWRLQQAATSPTGEEPAP